MVWEAIKSFLLQNGDDVCEVVKRGMKDFGIEPIYDVPAFMHSPIFQEIDRELNICVPFGSYVMKDVRESTFCHMQQLLIPYVVVLRHTVYVRPFETYCQLDSGLFDKITWVIGGVLDKCRDMESKTMADRHRYRDDCHSDRDDRRSDRDDRRSDRDDRHSDRDGDQGYYRNNCKDRRLLCMDAVWNGYMGSFHLMSNNRFAVADLHEWLKKSQKDYNHFLM
jgi:hypothetical protein